MARRKRNGRRRDPLRRFDWARYRRGQCSVEGCTRERAARKKLCHQHQFERRLRRYRLGPDDGFDLWHFQRGQCAICATAFRTPHDANIDHDHATDEVRGLLCSSCNSGLAAVDAGRREPTEFERHYLLITPWWTVQHERRKRGQQRLFRPRDS